MTREIVLATTNSNKLLEFQLLLQPEFMVLTRPLGVPKVNENGESYFANALLKLRAVEKLVRGVVAADDTGFEVDALNGAPGLYSARYSQGGDVANCKKLLNALIDIPTVERTALYKTIVVARLRSETIVVCEGTCCGTVAHGQRGTGGFGYDTIFIPSDGDGRTFAEMDPQDKIAISHRARAVTVLKGRMLSEIDELRT